MANKNERSSTLPSTYKKMLALMDVSETRRNELKTLLLEAHRNYVDYTKNRKAFNTDSQEDEKTVNGEDAVVNT